MWSSCSCKPHSAYHPLNYIVTVLQVMVGDWEQSLSLCVCTSSDLNILIALQNMWTVRYTLGTYFMVYSEADELGKERSGKPCFYKH